VVVVAGAMHHAVEAWLHPTLGVVAHVWVVGQEEEEEG